MWGLTYDYLTGYTMKDMSPAPGLATKWTTSSGRQDLDLHRAQRREVLRRGAADREGRRLHLRPRSCTKDSVEGIELAVLPQRRHQGDRAERHDRRAEAEGAQRDPPAAADPDRARAHLEERQREGDEDLQGRADRRQAGRRAPGPFRLVQGTADGSTFKFEANPDYWGGTPHIDEIDFQFYKNDDSAVQALIKGEVDFVEGITALEVKSLQSQAGVTAHNGNSPGFDEIAFNAGSVSDRDGRAPDRQPQPGRARPEVPARPRLRAQPAAADPRRSTRAPACRAPRSSRRSTTSTTGSRRPTRSSPSTWPRPASCSTPPATRRAPTGSAPCPTASRSGRCGWRRAPTRPPR